MTWPAPDFEHLLLSSRAMQQLEEALFAQGLPVAALMEQAGLGLAQAVLQNTDLKRHGLLVLVGPGHNGGDGLVVARELHLRGIAVRIWSPFNTHKPLTAEHLRYAQWLGIPQLETAPDPSNPALWLDALFGLGQQRPLSPELSQLLQARQRSGGLIWSIDGPSGLDSDTGLPTGNGTACCQRSLIVGLWKRGFWQDSAMAWVGEQQRIPLSLPTSVLPSLGEEASLGLWSSDLLSSSAPWPQPPMAATKHGRGRLRVIAGCSDYLGAARLSLEAASSSGIGWLEGVVPEPLAQQLWQVLPHVLLPKPETPLERLDAVAYGPGLGSGALNAELQDFAGLLLLDADGLNRLAAQGNVQHWLQQRRGPTWLTPHAAEFQRLFPELAELPPHQATSQAAQQSQCWVLRKGARTLIASPDGAVRQVLQSDARAARAGLGDVLSGYAAGLGAIGLGSGLHKTDARFDGLLALAALAHATAGIRQSQAGEGAASPLAIAQQLQNAKNAAICEQAENGLKHK